MSPSGNDANSGSKDHPLATLAKGRDLVRQFRKLHPDEDVTVWISGGTYRITETLTFTLEDTNSQVRSITWAAAPGAKPVLSGAALVRGWTKN